MYGRSSEISSTDGGLGESWDPDWERDSYGNYNLQPAMDAPDSMSSRRLEIDMRSHIPVLASIDRKVQKLFDHGLADKISDETANISSTSGRGYRQAPRTPTPMFNWGSSSAFSRPMVSEN